MSGRPRSVGNAHNVQFQLPSKMLSSRMSAE
jgi:hypothetical protein